MANSSFLQLVEGLFRGIVETWKTQQEMIRIKEEAENDVLKFKLRTKVIKTEEQREEEELNKLYPDFTSVYADIVQAKVDKDVDILQNPSSSSTSTAAATSANSNANASAGGELEGVSAEIAALMQLGETDMNAILVIYRLVFVPFSFTSSSSSSSSSSSTSSSSSSFMSKLSGSQWKSARNTMLSALSTLRVVAYAAAYNASHLVMSALNDMQQVDIIPFLRKTAIHSLSLVH
jgi:hypothetical protein